MSKKELRIPKENLYTDKHIWICRANGSNEIFIVGITDYAQDQLNEILFVDIPDEGASIEADECFGEVESLKAVNELYMPVSGTVITVNESLNESPTLLNESPYDRGWIMKIKVDNIKNIDSLLSAKVYTEITTD